MGLWRYLRGTDLLEDRSTAPTGEARSLPPAENELPLLASYTASAITPNAALAIADVWAAVRVLADAASSLPLHVYRKSDDGRERVSSGKLVDLLDRPGPATSQADLVSSLMSHLAIEDGDLVFCNTAGNYLDHAALRRRYYRALTKAGLRRIRFHDLRHCFGSAAITKLDPYAVQSYMGHQHYSTTQRYLHHKPRPQDAQALHEAFGGAQSIVQEVAPR